MMTGKRLSGLTAAVVLAAGCSTPAQDPAPQAVAGTALRACSALPTQFKFANTAITSAVDVPAGTLNVAGVPIAAHCLVTGKMYERMSPVDGQIYAIGFEMRLPTNWNGRFFHQGNGGLDGAVVPAVGAVSGGGALTNALSQGFAVLSSDAGHANNQNPLFGLDPQARLDYGFQAVGKLTPMAKGLIRSAYAKLPDRSYIGGCSNGGRHVLVAAARYADQYDGFLAGDPGFNLPQAAIAQLYGAQQYATITTDADLGAAFTPAERKLVANKVLEKCDALDGVADGMVNATARCQQAFDLARDVETCGGARTGMCLTPVQKTAINNTFKGARDSTGKALYRSFPYDAGIVGSDWAGWKFVASSTNRDPPAVAYIFQTPPAEAALLRDMRAFALGFNIDRDAGKIFADGGVYSMSSMEFMTPPDPTQLATLKRRGKLMVYHGTSDPVFSSDDTAAWYDGLRAANGGDASGFARFYTVPGMNHCRGGPSTDQFDMLSALVNWVEKDQAPNAIIATARGAGNAGGVNAELPADWAANRTRLLCPYPQVATYRGSGDSERAENFSCR